MVGLATKRTPELLQGAINQATEKLSQLFCKAQHCQLLTGIAANRSDIAPPINCYRPEPDSERTNESRRCERYCCESVHEEIPNFASLLDFSAQCDAKCAPENQKSLPPKVLHSWNKLSFLRLRLFIGTRQRNPQHCADNAINTATPIYRTIPVFISTPHSYR